MKRLVIAVDSSKLQDAIQEWRNTPRADGVSPSMGFFGRRTRGTVPFLNQPMAAFPPHAPLEDHSGRVLQPLAPESKVWVQLRPGETWKRGTIITRKSERSYLVEIVGGRCYLRNRRFLRPVKPEAVVAPENRDEPEAVVAPENRDEPEAVVAPELPRRSRRTAGLRPENEPLLGSRV